MFYGQDCLLYFTDVDASKLVFGMQFVSSTLVQKSDAGIDLRW